MTYNPDYVPTGPNNRDNEYYKKINHVKLARVDYSRTEFFGTIGGEPARGPVVTSPPVLTPDPVTVGNDVSMTMGVFAPNPETGEAIDYYEYSIGTTTGTTTSAAFVAVYTTQAGDEGTIAGSVTAVDISGARRAASSNSVLVEAVPADAGLKPVAHLTLPNIYGFDGVSANYAGSDFIPRVRTINGEALEVEAVTASTIGEGRIRLVNDVQWTDTTRISLDYNGTVYDRYVWDAGDTCYCKADGSGIGADMAANVGVFQPATIIDTTLRAQNNDFTVSSGSVDDEFVLSIDGSWTGATDIKYSTDGGTVFRSLGSVVQTDYQISLQGDGTPTVGGDVYSVKILPVDADGDGIANPTAKSVTAYDGTAPIVTNAAAELWSGTEMRLSADIAEAIGAPDGKAAHYMYGYAVLTGNAPPDFNDMVTNGYRQYNAGWGTERQTTAIGLSPGVTYDTYLAVRKYPSGPDYGPFFAGTLTTPALSALNDLGMTIAPISEATIPVWGKRTTEIDFEGGTPAATVITDQSAVRAAGGYITVKDDMTLSLVLTKSSHTGALSFNVTLDATPRTINMDVLPAPQENGWGDLTQTYNLEVDGTGALVLEKGPRHRPVYTTKDTTPRASGGPWTAVDIVAAEPGLSDPSEVTGAWLEANPMYGGDELNALDDPLGKELWGQLAPNWMTPSSYWLMLERGYIYDINLFGRGAMGESGMEPLAVRAWGTGANPIHTGGYNLVNNNVCRHIVTDGIDFTGLMSVLGTATEGHRNIMAARGTGKGFISQGVGEFVNRGITFKDFAQADVYQESALALAGDGQRWEALQNRATAWFASATYGVVFDGSAIFFSGYKRNDFHPGQSPGTGDDLGGLAGPLPSGPFLGTAAGFRHPPSAFSHNGYGDHDVEGMEFIDFLTWGSASYGFHVRGGGVLRRALLMVNNIPVDFLGGNYQGRKPGRGFNGMYDTMIQHAQRLAPWVPNPGGQDWGVYNHALLTVIRDSAIAHANDPDDLGDTDMGQIAIKHEYGVWSNAFKGDTFMVYRWAFLDKDEVPQTEQNVGGIPDAQMDVKTLIRYAEEQLGLGPGATLNDLADYFIAVTPENRVAEHRALLNWLRPGWNLPVLLTRTVPQTMRWRPSQDTAGLYVQERECWEANDELIDGDSVELRGGHAESTRKTYALSDIDMGNGGEWLQSGGRTSFATITDVAGQKFHTTNAGKIFVGNHAGVNAVTVQVDDGRFGVSGSWTGVLDITLNRGDVHAAGTIAPAAGSTVTLSRYDDYQSNAAFPRFTGVGTFNATNADVVINTGGAPNGDYSLGQVGIWIGQFNSISGTGLSSQDGELVMDTNTGEVVLRISTGTGVWSQSNSLRALLTNATAAATGTMTADVGVTTDTGNGNMFWAARLDTDPVLDKTDIENNTGNAVATTTEIVSATGVQSSNLAGLTEDTNYIVDQFQRDSGGTESLVVSSPSFKTDAAPAGTAYTVVMSTGGGNVSGPPDPTTYPAPWDAINFTFLQVWNSGTIRCYMSPEEEGMTGMYVVIDGVTYNFVVQPGAGYYVSAGSTAAYDFMNTDLGTPRPFVLGFT